MTFLSNLLHLPTTRVLDGSWSVRASEQVSRRPRQRWPVLRRFLSWLRLHPGYQDTPSDQALAGLSPTTRIPRH